MNDFNFTVICNQLCDVRFNNILLGLVWQLIFYQSFSSKSDLVKIFIKSKQILEAKTAENVKSKQNLFNLFIPLFNFVFYKTKGYNI